MAYGCYNRKPLQLVRKVQDGWYADGRRKMVSISDNLSKNCKYAEHGYATKDEKCSNCKHKGSINGTA